MGRAKHRRSDPNNDWAIQISTEQSKQWNDPYNGVMRTTEQLKQLSDPNNHWAIEMTGRSNDGAIQTTGRSKRRSDPNDGAIQTTERSKQRSNPNDGAIQTTGRSKQWSNPNDGVIWTTEQSKRQSNPNDGAIQTTERSKRREDPNNDRVIQTTEQSKWWGDSNDGAIQTKGRSKQRQNYPNDGAIQRRGDLNHGTIQMTERSKQRRLVWEIQIIPNDGAMQATERSAAKQTRNKRFEGRSDPSDGVNPGDPNHDSEAIQTRERSKWLGNVNDGTTQMTGRSKPNDGAILLEMTRTALRTKWLRPDSNCQWFGFKLVRLGDPNDGAIQNDWPEYQTNHARPILSTMPHCHLRTKRCGKLGNRLPVTQIQSTERLDPNVGANDSDGPENQTGGTKWSNHTKP